MKLELIQQIINTLTNAIVLIIIMGTLGSALFFMNYLRSDD
jgi:hypothetical protein